MLFHIDVESTHDDIPVIRPHGEIDLHTCGTFRDSLRDLIEARRFHLIVDLADVPYVDSAALGVLVDAVRRAREHEGSISLVASTPFVRRAFEITHLVKIFQLYDDNESALADVRSALKSHAGH